MQVTIVNVYAPCDMRGKRLLWDELKLQMDNRGGDRWCILEDFNSIKSPGERKGVDGNSRSDEIQSFGDFIVEAELIDLPLIARKHTCTLPKIHSDSVFFPHSDSAFKRFLIRRYLYSDNA